MGLIQVISHRFDPCSCYNNNAITKAEQHVFHISSRVWSCFLMMTSPQRLVTEDIQDGSTNNDISSSVCNS